MSVEPFAPFLDVGCYRFLTETYELRFLFAGQSSGIWDQPEALTLALHQTVGS